MEELIGHLKNDFEVEEYTRKHIQIKWAKSDKYPETYIKCIPYYSTEWTSVSRIEAEDIAFKTPSANPSYIFFVKMEE